MSLDNKSKSALRAFHMAHRFLNEFKIRWLPVDPFEIISKQKNWHLKYADGLAYEIGKDRQYVLDHIMRSNDGVAIYDVALNQYDIILNNDESIPQTRMLWTVVHEIGHIYLGHLDNKRTKISKNLLERSEYEQLEFEADIFAGEVLASKWLMRQLDIVNENDIALICGISDDAALSRYRKATEDYDYIPVNVVLTLHNFEDFLKNVAICKDIDDLGPYSRYLYQNPILDKLSKPKPRFLRSEKSCPYCGNETGVTKEACFCIACGSKLKLTANQSDKPCEHINHERAAFCEMCGHRVYRMKQGFCFEECEL